MLNIFPNNISKDLKIKFQKIYEKQLFPYLKKKEEYRTIHYKAAIVLSIVCFIISTTIITQILSINTLDKNDYEIIFGLFLIGIGTPFTIFSLLESRLNYKIKCDIMPMICRLFGNLEWKPKFKDDTSIKKSNLIEQYNSFSFDDVFFGVYKIYPLKFMNQNLASKDTMVEIHKL